MSFKLDIITVDDGEVSEVFGNASEALDYITDSVDPSLVGSMVLTDSDGTKVRNYYNICEYLVKAEYKKKPL